MRERERERVREREREREREQPEDERKCPKDFIKKKLQNGRDVESLALCVPWR